MWYVEREILLNKVRRIYTCSIDDYREKQRDDRPRTARSLVVTDCARLATRRAQGPFPATDKACMPPCSEEGSTWRDPAAAAPRRSGATMGAMAARWNTQRRKRHVSCELLNVMENNSSNRRQNCANLQWIYLGAGTKKLSLDRLTTASLKAEEASWGIIPLARFELTNVRPPLA